jgi:hypothetical protein
VRMDIGQSKLSDSHAAYPRRVSDCLWATPTWVRGNKRQPETHLAT